MKIEKVNDNQIKCTLTKKDLEERHIKLSELAYGSEKASRLFHDMVEKASYEFGFEAEDAPLMVEAIPGKEDTLVLIISKVEYPDELDTRFSRFSDPDDDLSLEQGKKAESLISGQGAADILNLFEQMKEEIEEESAHAEEEDADEGSDKDPDKNDGKHGYLEEVRAKLKPLFEKSSDKEDAKDSGEKPADKDKGPVLDPKADLVNAFAFSSMDKVERLAKVLKGNYHGESDLYRIEDSEEFFLFLHKNDHTPEEYNRICNITAEYSGQLHYTPAMKAFFVEHGRPICKGNAMTLLADL